MNSDHLQGLADRIDILKARTVGVTQRLEKADSYTPPEGVRSAAARGLAMRAKWKRGGLSNSEASDQGIGSGVQRATNLKNGDAIGLDTVKRMAAFFSRHAKNYRPDEKESDGGPTAGTIAWLLWGGNAGKAWSESIVNRVQKDEGGAAGGPDAGDVHVPSTEWGNKPKRKKAATKKGSSSRG